MQWLVRSACTHDSLFFHCKPSHCWCHFSQLIRVVKIDSGHGGQTKDLDGDEVDGYDEGIPFRVSESLLELTALSLLVIYPVDFKKRGHIVDDVCLISHYDSTL